jgi:hypothetical protein
LEDRLGFHLRRGHANDLEHTADEGGRARRAEEDIVTGMVDSKAKIDSDGALGDVVEVTVLLGGESDTLAIGVLDETHSTEREESLGGFRVELRAPLVELDIGDSGYGEGRLGGQVDAVRAVTLQVQDELGWQVVGSGLEDGDGLLVDLLDSALDLVAVGVRSSMGDVGMEEPKVGGQGEADGL